MDVTVLLALGVSAQLTESETTMYPSQKVTIETRSVGQAFATVGVVLDQSGNELARGEIVCFGMDGAARSSAEREIEKHNSNANVLWVTAETAEIKVTIRAIAFGGILEPIRCLVAPNGTVTVYDRVAGHYTTCHSLSKRDLGRVRSAARKSVEDCD